MDLPSIRESSDMARKRAIDNRTSIEDALKLNLETAKKTFSIY
jgi:hypothetical protein